MEPLSSRIAHYHTEVKKISDPKKIDIVREDAFNEIIEVIPKNNTLLKMKSLEKIIHSETSLGTRKKLPRLNLKCLNGCYGNSTETLEELCDNRKHCDKPSLISCCISPSIEKECSPGRKRNIVRPSDLTEAKSTKQVTNPRKAKCDVIEIRIENVCSETKEMQDITLKRDSVVNACDKSNPQSAITQCAKSCNVQLHSECPCNDSDRISLNSGDNGASTDSISLNNGGNGVIAERIPLNDRETKGNESTGISPLSNSDGASLNSGVNYSNDSLDEKFCNINTKVLNGHEGTRNNVSVGCTESNSDESNETHALQNRSRRATRNKKISKRNKSSPTFSNKHVRDIVIDLEEYNNNLIKQSTLKIVDRKPRKLSAPEKAFNSSVNIDTNRFRENGRLVFYFKSPERPRSLSPNYRVTCYGERRRSGESQESRESPSPNYRLTSDRDRGRSGESDLSSSDEKLRTSVYNLRDLYKEQYKLYTGRPWSAGSAI